MNTSKCFIFILFWLLPIQWSLAESLPQRQPMAHAKYLIVINAKEIQIAKQGNNFQLVLKGINPNTLFFAERPVRKAGLVSTAKLMKNWLRKTSSFSTTPPNAVLVFEVPTDKSNLTPGIAVELSHPQQIGKEDWSFSAHDLEGKIQIGNFQKPALFIDALEKLSA